MPLFPEHPPPTPVAPFTVARVCLCVCACACACRERERRWLERGIRDKLRVEEVRRAELERARRASSIAALVRKREEMRGQVGAIQREVVADDNFERAAELPTLDAHVAHLAGLEEGYESQALLLGTAWTAGCSFSRK